MIVTLAGHVDHGKTSLVKALTGVDTDVLEDERRRGLTIDLGFAYQRQDDSFQRPKDSFQRPKGDVLGFIDVPGHHRFIHNMVAGVAAMQFALLVV
ncbi:MAG: GTP-binding protein, partial [Gammaproteobacteria bacterium]|nr:GTP-binding protein [Gammaproteobacteria bacterium]